MAVTGDVKRPPGRVPKRVKKGMRKASKKTYALMLAAATKLVMENRGRPADGGPEYVLMEFPYFAKFPVGFPKRIVDSKTAMTTVHRVNAIKLLNWLHENGHSPYNAATLVAQTKQFEVLTKGIDKMFEM